MAQWQSRRFPPGGPRFKSQLFVKSLSKLLLCHLQLHMAKTITATLCSFEYSVDKDVGSTDEDEAAT